MKPILFNTGMVCAILGGYKTATRRVAYPNADIREFPRPDNPDAWWFRGRAYRSWNDMLTSPQGVMCSCKYHKGDILYVRETWAYGFIETPDQPGYSSEWFKGVDRKKASDYLKAVSRYFYRADMDDADAKTIEMRWHPSIHMPKEAARIFLRVTDVRLERLQSISYEQAKREGIEVRYDEYKNGSLEYRAEVTEEEFEWGKVAIAELWDGTVKPKDRDRYGWDANPWVWVIEFERIEKNP